MKRGRLVGVRSLLLVLAALMLAAAKWDVYKGDRKVLEVSNVPGPLTGTAVPPPGVQPPRHPFLSGSTLYAPEEGALRKILDGSKDFADFLERLKEAGYRAEPAIETGGDIMTIMSSTQGNFGKLGIGAGFMNVGPYLDEKGVKRYGIYATLAITVEDDPSQFQQPDVHVGQTFKVAGYRITVIEINPGERGTIVLNVFAPPEPPKPAKHGFFSWFGL